MMNFASSSYLPCQAVLVPTHPGGSQTLTVFPNACVYPDEVTAWMREVEDLLKTVDDLADSRLFRILDAEIQSRLMHLYEDGDRELGNIAIG